MKCMYQVFKMHMLWKILTFNRILRIREWHTVMRNNIICTLIVPYNYILSETIEGSCRLYLISSADKINTDKRNNKCTSFGSHGHMRWTSNHIIQCSVWQLLYIDMYKPELKLNWAERGELIERKALPGDFLKWITNGNFLRYVDRAK